jgi:hypothetical protein
MRIMSRVVGMIPPLTTIFVPQMFAAETPFFRATGWSWFQLSLDGRANTLRRQTWLLTGL